MFLRSLLFVPGNKPERFAKALAANPDAICIDLEDAVPPAEKVDAREQACTFVAGLESAQTQQVCVRLNPLTTELGQQDLKAMQANPPALVMLAKCQSADEVRQCEQALGAQVKVIALIESVLGMQQAEAIAASSPQLLALMFGGADLAAELGCEFSYEPLQYARSRLIFAAASAGLQAIDVPHIDLNDEADLIAETNKIRALGFTGKAAIHPKQIAVIHQALRPSDEQIAQAKQILEAAQANNSGVLVIAGRMVDRPVILGCQRILALAGQNTNNDTLN